MHHIRSNSTTPEALEAIGARLRAYRLRQNMSYEELARAAGVGRATIARAESGRNINLETVVKMLRALGRLEALETFLPEPLVSPIQLAALRGRERQRARRRVSTTPTPPPPPARDKSLHGSQAHASEVRAPHV